MVMNNDFSTDPVIQALIGEATADSDVIGLVLTGSRSIGATEPDSDYEVVFVVTDEAMACYEATNVSPMRGSTLLHQSARKICGTKHRAACNWQTL
jgi:hypothetical protein